MLAGETNGVSDSGWPCQPHILYQKVSYTKREKRPPYREFGVHFSLTAVTEKAMRWNSRSLRHLAQPSTNSDVGPPQTRHSCPPPARHAPRRRTANQSEGSGAGGRKCRCVVKEKPHVLSLGVSLRDASKQGLPQFRNSAGKVCGKNIGVDS